MIILLSPAKTLDFKKHNKIIESSKTRFDEKSQQLINKLSRSSLKGLRELMHISKDLAVVNKQRYEEYDIEKLEERGKEAVLAFNGGVYQGLDANTLPDNAFDYTQDHVRILSGLYGILRPLDRIQEYRLEMGTKLPIRRKKNLYEFWKDKITPQLNSEIAEGEIVVNLASNEYFKAVDKKKLNGELISPVFKDYKNGKLKVISFFAKKARGTMARFLVENKSSTLEDILSFQEDDYRYSEKDTTRENEPVFVR